MKTRKDIIDKIDSILEIENTKLAQSKLDKNEAKTKLHQNKADGLKQIKAELNALVSEDVGTRWLKQTISKVSKQYPMLTQGASSTIKNLFNESAPGWDQGNPKKLIAQENKDEPFKVLVVGDIGVGKTAMIRNAIHGVWKLNYKPTLDVAYDLKLISNKKLQVWDVSGQERFGSMLSYYAKNTSELIFVFDLTRPSSFSVGVKELYKQLEATLDDFSDLPKILVANKLDLAPNDGDGELIKQGRQFAKEKKMTYVVMSAKEKVLTDDLFNRAASLLGVQNKTQEKPELIEAELIENNEEKIVMKTRKSIIDKIDPIFGTENNKLEQARINKNKDKIKLHEDKVNGLGEIKAKLNQLVNENVEDAWLKQIISNAVKQYPDLTKGLTSKIKSLFNEIAPGWEKVPAVSSVASGATLFSQPAKPADDSTDELDSDLTNAHQQSPSSSM